jgi:hypothetical protein
MLVFIVPVKSSQLSRISWELSSRILERCIKSICNQTSLDFRVLVVHHEKPIIEFQHPSIEYIQVDFPIPTWSEPASPFRDKSRKLWVGLNSAIKLNPTHIMFVDSDDCLNRNLANFVNQNPEQNGWYIANGYEYPDATGRIYHRKKIFYLKCGTSHIIRSDLLLPFAELKFEEITDRFLWHQDIVPRFAEKGVRLDPLPFDGAVYISDTGENHDNLTELFVKQFKSDPVGLTLFWARRTYKAIRSISLNDQICNDFSLYKL